MKRNVSLEEAQSLLLERAEAIGEECLSLLEANGRILSQDIKAPINIPGFDKSALDGYALIAADTVLAEPSNPVLLNVIDETRAGFQAKEKVIPGTAVKLMTGAPIPEGADVVIKYEEIIRNGDVISVFKPLKARDNIIKEGEDIKQGDLAAAKGMRINPGLVALLAGLGIDHVPVYKQLKIAIMSTGDELLRPGEPLQSGKIYNSSLFGIMARCAEMGARPIDLGIVPDDLDITSTRFAQGLEEADMVISTGGVSVGDYDVVKNAMVDAGAEIIFWQVAMKPGSPMVAAVREKQFVIGLSGNPAAAMVTFDLIVIPLIKKLMGIENPLPVKIQGIFDDKFTKASPQRRLLRTGPTPHAARLGQGKPP
ncbi:MAG: molybdopterin molybdotransferase MoeA [Syntrophomonadaceae bacterium]|nr:molybdopterin molybdotransferase MoeA [Syntrophomonadaceae bacterium]